MLDSIPQRQRSAGRKHLVLLGAGISHLHLLARLARQPQPELRVTLVAGATRHLDPSMLPAFIAGSADLERCSVALNPLLQRIGVQHLTRRAIVLDAPNRTVALDDGQALEYDWLSVDCGPNQDRNHLEALLPGAREHGLFSYPTHLLAGLWPQVLELPANRLRSLAVIGPGPQAMVLALALRHRLAHSAITLVTGGQPLAAGHGEALAACIRLEFRRQSITVLNDQALGLRRGEVLLGCGARLACDVPLIVAGQAPPGWLTSSGLALDASGQLKVDCFQRSTSHREVMLAPDLAAQVPAAALLEDGLAQWRLAPRLADNIVRMANGAEPHALPIGPRRIRWLAGGNGVALVGWAGLAGRSRWLGAWHAAALDGCLRQLRLGPA